MRKYGKLTAVALVVAMLVSLMSISVFAADGETLIDLTLTADKQTVQVGDSFDVSIDFTPKSGAMFVQGAATFRLRYDKNIFDATVKVSTQIGKEHLIPN